MNTQYSKQLVVRLLSVSAVLVLALSPLGGALAKESTAYVVNTTNDRDDGACNKGHCSLREAINAANSHPGADMITFNLRGRPPFTIQPSSALPGITDPLTIDGSTQPGFHDNPIIELDGENAGGDEDNQVNGLMILAGDSTIRGLVINRFSGEGIFLTTNGGNRIEGNFIGTDVTGTVALGNGLRGIFVLGESAGNFIGGTQPHAGNLVSGNGLAGVRFESTEGNKVQGNLIGTDISGTSPLGNGNFGIAIDSASNNVIGGLEPGARNIISANGAVDGAEGVFLEGATGNIVQGNYIGTDLTGTQPMGNNGSGVALILGSPDNLIVGNLISANGGDGVVIADPGTTGNILQGNLIGTDVSGAAALPNGADGVRILGGATHTLIGGTEDGARNLISGNTYIGVSIWDTGTSDNIVQGNTIGTDLTGTQPLGNSADGVSIASGATNNHISGNLISANGTTGVRIADPDTTGNKVQGNFIGTDVTGTSPLRNIIGIWVTEGAADNLIGGTEDGARNIVSGNLYNVGLGGGSGATGNTVQGNYIGTDRSGSVALANSGAGVFIYDNGSDNLVGGTEPGAGNLISGNTFGGVFMISPGVIGNIVQGNFIGTDASGTKPLGNLADGVIISYGAANNLIGGTEPEAGNTVAFNGSTGIALSIDAGSGNSLLSNLAFSNEGLGIDLGDDGVTPNDPQDPDTGPNDLQNYPVITGVTPKGTSVMIHGTLDSTPNTTFRLEFFSNATCDPSGFGEGQVFLGFAMITTNPAGFASFNVPVSLPQGAFVTATATNPAGSSSEFSNCFSSR